MSVKCNINDNNNSNSNDDYRDDYNNKNFYRKKCLLLEGVIVNIIIINCSFLVF